jgi:hypothetical protein
MGSGPDAAQFEVLPWLEIEPMKASTQTASRTEHPSEWETVQPRLNCYSPYGREAMFPPLWNDVELQIVGVILNCRVGFSFGS